jgi:DNA-binding beta-propeller fold protein YncE
LIRRASLAVIFAASIAAAALAEGPATGRPAAQGPKFYLRPTVVFSGHLYEGEFLEPMSVFLDPKSGEVFVADTKNGLIGIFTAEGAPLFAFGSEELREPTRVAADPGGRIYVLDNDRTKIKVFSYRGQYLGPLELPGVGEKPSFGALTFDADGNLYVGENETCRVLVYSPDRKLKLRLGECGVGPGQFQAITGIAADKERIAVTDAQVVSVQLFDRRGDFVKGWGAHDMGIQNFSLPQSVAFASQGRIAVIDTLRHELKFFDREGNFLDRFGGLGSRIGQLAFPSGVAADASGRIIVVEKGNSRVQVFAEVEGSIPEENRNAAGAPARQNPSSTPPESASGGGPPAGNRPD